MEETAAVEVARRQPGRGGFTLFEVAMSLGLVAIAVLSVLALFPTGIKAQQMARYRLYAAAKSLEMVEVFNTGLSGSRQGENEAPGAWDVPVSRRSDAPDLECRLINHRNGLAPLPREIAARLDSDDDEIQTILSQGGQIYYAKASPTLGQVEYMVDAPRDNLLQKLVFAVEGYAQDNSLPVLPRKSWPYYVPYPSPPGFGVKLDQFMPPPRPAALANNRFTIDGLPCYCWEGVGTEGAADAGQGNADLDIARVFESKAGGVSYGFKPYAYGPGDAVPASSSAPTYDGAVRYLQAALWYCAKKGLPTAFYEPSDTGAFPDFDPALPWWQQVQAMRFLSHAATCITRWRTLADLGGQPSQGGIAIPGVLIDDREALPSPAIVLTHDKIVFYHELGLRLAMKYAAYLPYDWGAPRPVQRALMTDYPLIEYDLFPGPASPLLTGTIFDNGPGSVAAAQWRPVPAQPIANIGRSYEFPDRPADDRWGDPAHFTLAKPFQPCERCRQIVFWAVDWQSYEDFETAASAPLDASRYLFTGPLAGRPFDARMDRRYGSGLHGMGWLDVAIFSFRNPEISTVYLKPVTELADGTPTPGAPDDAVQAYDPWDYYTDPNSGMWNNSAVDQGTQPRNIRCFLGANGADRNGNYRLDRGPLPRTARLRATTVARFAYYDARVPLQVR